MFMILPPPWEREVVFPMLQMRKLSQRETERFAQHVFCSLSFLPLLTSLLLALALDPNIALSSS